MVCRLNAMCAVIAGRSIARLGSLSSSNPLYDSMEFINRAPRSGPVARASKAYLKTLVEKLKIHAINAISSTDARPFWRWQIDS